MKWGKALDDDDEWDYYNFYFLPEWPINGLIFYSFFKINFLNPWIHLDHMAGTAKMGSADDEFGKSNK